MEKYEVSVDFARFMLAQKKKELWPCPLCGRPPTLAVNKDNGEFMACCFEPGCKDRIRTPDCKTLGELEQVWRKLCAAHNAP